MERPRFCKSTTYIILILGESPWTHSAHSAPDATRKFIYITVDIDLGRISRRRVEGKMLSCVDKHTNYKRQICGKQVQYE